MTLSELLNNGELFILILDKTILNDEDLKVLDFIMFNEYGNRLCSRNLINHFNNNTITEMINNYYNFFKFKWLKIKNALSIDYSYINEKYEENLKDNTYNITSNISKNNSENVSEEEEKTGNDNTVNNSETGKYAFNSTNFVLENGSNSENDENFIFNNALNRTNTRIETLNNSSENNLTSSVIKTGNMRTAESFIYSEIGIADINYYKIIINDVLSLITINIF